MLTYCKFYKKKVFDIIKIKPSTIIYHSIDNFMGYKMMVNHRGKYVTFKVSSVPQYPKTMKNSYTLTLRQSYLCLFPIKTASFLCTQKVNVTTDWV